MKKRRFSQINANWIKINYYLRFQTNTLNR